MAMRVIVAGAVAWSDAAAIRRELAALPAGSVIIHGDAPGADVIAGEVGRELGLAVEPMAKNAADRAKYKKAAWKGLNERMLASGAVLVLAFHADLAASKGTRHLVELAREAGVEARVFAS
jgi:hypothetical protein